MIKRVIFIVLIAIFFTSLAGCQFVKPNNNSPSPNHHKGYKSISNDVIETHGGLENIERLNLFVKNVQGRKMDKTRLIRYTIEGAPIFHDLDFNGSNLTLTLDTTRDQYGQGEVKKFHCKGIKRQETNTETKYILTGCSNTQMKDLLTISHNVDKEDYFAFRLRYGIGKKNEIDTKNEKLVKDLQNGKTVVVNDFRLSKEDMNKVYKYMVFSNYLEKKWLSVKCNKKPYESYQLYVWINGAERLFAWSECDNSNDGTKMTTMANNIINIVKKNPIYQTLPD